MQINEHTGADFETRPTPFGAHVGATLAPDNVRDDSLKIDALKYFRRSPLFVSGGFILSVLQAAASTIMELTVSLQLL